MTVCACFLVWAGWFATTEESLALCLNRRHLPPSIMLPSQLRCIHYFESVIDGTHPNPQTLQLSRISVSNVPDLEQGGCTLFIEVYNKNRLVYCSYRKGSKVKGVVERVKAGDTVVFKPEVAIQVMIVNDDDSE